MSDFGVRAAGPEDADEIRELHRKVFGTEMPREEWSWKFERNPDGRFGTVAEVGGKIVGNYAGWGMRFRVAGEPALVYSVGDVATDRAVRGLGGRHGVYRTMADAFYGALAGKVPLCFGFPNDRALAISNRLAGTRTLQSVRQVLVACDVLASSSCARGSGDSVSKAFDSLWETASEFLTDAPVRDRVRVNWRFHARPGRYYRMVWLPGSGPTTAWAVLSVAGENALVADFLGSDPAGGDLPALFAAAASEAREMGARRLVFWETPGGPGRDAIAALPGTRESAGFSMIVRVLDEPRFAGFGRNLHLVPSLYDLV